ncbi:UNVERIFIED_CONTAM: hypothetical protein GTU68_046977 [Idotea baltica]|nr:hypothetical protein [Idotea baltica]
MSFKDLQLNKPLLRAIANAGYDNPTLVQERTIPLVLERKDVICSAQTGTGKTAAFALPILQQLFDKQDAPKKGKKIRALIVSPTRELAIQIQESFKTYATNTNLSSTVIYGGTSIEPQKDVLKKGVDILIATPGRLLDLHKQDCINLDYIETDKAQNLRQDALKKFKNGYVNILIATDVAARGIDINELDAVVNFDLPNIPETYVHRIGRTGRAGHFGNSYSLCSADEKAYIKSIQQLINVQIPIEEDHPYPLDPKAKPIQHKSKKTGSKHKKGRKSEASKKKKKRWY